MSDSDSENERDKDLMNYKGIFINEEPKIGQDKIADPVTGAHFEFKDVCKRLNQVIR